MAEARTALELITEGRALDTDEEVRAWVEEQADDITLAQWERTKKTHKLSVAAPVLKLNRQLPGIEELLTIKKYEKLISSFGRDIGIEVQSPNQAPPSQSAFEWGDHWAHELQ